MIPAALRFAVPAPWPTSSFQVPRFQAHRGYWAGGFQENTIEAFRAARAAGFRMAELDVQLDLHGEAVVFHDEDLRRLGGRRQKTRELGADELRRRVKAPRLIEVLKDAAGPDFYNIEIKAPLAIAGRVEPAVARAIREARAEDRVMISSFNPFSLGLMTELLPAVPRALLATMRREEGNFLALRRLWFTPFLRLHMLNLESEMLTPALVSFLRSRSFPFSAWTVNESSRAEELIEQGATSIITDRLRPDGLRTFF